jgi:acyl carrier protein
MRRHAVASEDLYDLESIQQAMAADARPSAIASQPYRAPSTPTERTIARIWEDLLGRKEVGVDEDLFSVGGDSIIALQILARTHESFHIQLRIDLLFKTSFTIEQLSRQVDEQVISEADPAELRALLQELEGLSEEEIGTLLEESNSERADGPAEQ